jgi:hypothetical protein
MALEMDQQLLIFLTCVVILFEVQGLTQMELRLDLLLQNKQMSLKAIFTQMVL